LSFLDSSQERESLSNSSRDAETWSNNVENETNLAGYDESWSKFLRLIEPERTYDKFFGWLTKVIQLMSLYRGCNVPAEDVAADTILRILRSMSKGTEIKKDTFNAFVIRVAKNHLIDHKRHEIGERFFSLFEFRNVKAVEPETEAHVKMGMLLKAESDLTDEEMQMLFLLSRGFSGTEIAAELDISEQSARKRVSRFRKKLRNKLIEISDREVPSGDHFRVKVNICDIEMGKRVNVSGLAHTVLQFPIRKSSAMAVAPRFWIGSEQSFIARAQGSRCSLEKARRDYANVARAQVKGTESKAAVSLEVTQAQLERAEPAQALALGKARLECVTAGRVQATSTEVAESEIIPEVPRLGYAEVTRLVGLQRVQVADADASVQLGKNFLRMLASELNAAGRFCPLPWFIGEQIHKYSAALD
jgi:RNA polymerase sigma factor (sigma-70 family)